jgi:hypothetical protein
MTNRVSKKKQEARQRKVEGKISRAQQQGLGCVRVLSNGEIFQVVRDTGDSYELLTPRNCPKQFVSKTCEGSTWIWCGPVELPPASLASETSCAVVQSVQPEVTSGNISGVVVETVNSIRASAIDEGDGRAAPDPSQNMVYAEVLPNPKPVTFPLDDGLSQGPLQVTYNSLQHQRSRLKNSTPSVSKPTPPGPRAGRRAAHRDCKQEVIDWLWYYEDNVFWSSCMTSVQKRNWPAFASCVRAEWVKLGGQRHEVNMLDNNGHCVDIAQKLHLY